MSRPSSKGTCYFCHGVFGKAGTTRHLAACPQRATTLEVAGNQQGKKTKVLHLLVDGRYLPEYWMHLEIPADATLATLDNFLRKIWLECCGHLSKFEIAEISYASYVDPEFGDKSMRVQVGKILSPGQQFSHEYDFGSTTELRLKVLSEREGEVKEKSIRVLARNEPPLVRCDVCGQPAKQTCTQCIYDEGGSLCEACAKDHACGEEMLLPVVNSPRVGVCGYTGAE
ncbi:MAG: hypothetical protein JO202_07525 [Ktedonobacteraceae bacterium]|nr:hypothetical protein [Ktedonobacteraceae bacterium]